MNCRGAATWFVWVACVPACVGTIEAETAPRAAVEAPQSAPADDKAPPEGHLLPPATSGSPATPAAWLTGATPGPEGRAKPSRAAEALEAEAARQIAVMRATAYAHETSVDEESGRFEYDCSGFLGYTLTRVLPAQLDAVKAFAGVDRPRSKDFTSFFASIELGASKVGWSRITRAIDLRPGDVIAWLQPQALSSGNTGHVMIVSGLPAPNSQRATEVLVPITDSTAVPHGEIDTRYPDDDGLGRGTVGLIVDAIGAPLRYRWSGGASATDYRTKITLARPE